MCICAREHTAVIPINTYISLQVQDVHTHTLTAGMKADICVVPGIVTHLPARRAVGPEHP